MFSHNLYIMSGSTTNLQTLTQQYNTTLNQYQNVYQNYINALNVSVNNGTTTTDFTASPQALQYQTQLQKLNYQLILINKQILVIIQKTPSQINNVNQQNQIQENNLKQNYSQLVNERKKLNNIINEYETIDKETGYTKEVVTSYYSRYIVLLFITILLFLL